MPEKETVIELVKYGPQLKQEWDEFIEKSKNGTFLFYRDYMDYHKDRFQDLSLMFNLKGKLCAVLPGNISEGRYYSHQGLTYGGLIMTDNLKSKEVINIFSSITAFLRSAGISEMIYKPVPYFYCSLPAQEDIYALFRSGAIKTDCKLSSVIYQLNKKGFKRLRLRGIQKGKRNNIRVKESESYNEFWFVLEENLKQKYNTNPVHTISEITLLKQRFPDNIKLYIAEMDGEIVAGTVLYLNPGSVHVQYIASNGNGRKSGALDLLFDTLVNKVFVTVPVFDFGTSNGALGQVLVEDLLYQKEGFGGRGVVYETYTLKI